jgi:hypothetical protein
VQAVTFQLSHQHSGFASQRSTVDGLRSLSALGSTPLPDRGEMRLVVSATEKRLTRQHLGSIWCGAAAFGACFGGAEQRRWALIVRKTGEHCKFAFRPKATSTTQYAMSASRRNRSPLSLAPGAPHRPQLFRRSKRFSSGSQVEPRRGREATFRLKSLYPYFF